MRIQAHQRIVASFMVVDEFPDSVWGNAGRNAHDTSWPVAGRHEM
jgi:hypothetical protein